MAISGRARSLLPCVCVLPRFASLDAPPTNSTSAPSNLFQPLPDRARAQKITDQKKSLPLLVNVLLTLKDPFPQVAHRPRIEAPSISTAIPFCILSFILCKIVRAFPAVHPLVITLREPDALAADLGTRFTTLHGQCPATLPLPGSSPSSSTSLSWMVNPSSSHVSTRTHYCTQQIAAVFGPHPSAGAQRYISSTPSAWESSIIFVLLGISATHPRSFSSFPSATWRL